MSEAQDTDLAGLKTLLNEGYMLIEQYNLYGVWDYIPKSHEVGFTDESMREYLKQNIMPRVFKGWSDKVEDHFSKNQLNYLKLKNRVLGNDSRKYSQFPVAIFIRTMRELELMQENQNLLNSYLAPESHSTTSPEITYKDGVIQQGTRKHRFNYDHYQDLFDLLWEKRRICDLQGNVQKEYEPTSRDEIFEIKGIGDIGRLKDTATGVRKSMKEKQISLKLKYPNAVFIEVIHK